MKMGIPRHHCTWWSHKYAYGIYKYAIDIGIIQEVGILLTIVIYYGSFNEADMFVVETGPSLNVFCI